MSELCECSSILWVLFKCVDVVLNDVTAAILRRLFNSTTVASLTLTTLTERKNNSKHPIVEDIDSRRAFHPDG